MLRVLVCACLMWGMAISAFAFTVTVGPVDPDFSAWRSDIAERTAAGAQVSGTVSAGHPLGYRPSPLNLEHLHGTSIVPTAEAAQDMAWNPVPTEASYSLVDLGMVTPIRDQNPYGTCWTFAAMASLESTRLMSDGVSMDLSEKYHAYFGYNDFSAEYVAYDQHPVDVGENQIYDQGGNNEISMALFSRWTGPVSEADVPYEDFSTAPGTDVQPMRHLSAVWIVPGGSTFTDNMKYAIKNIGAVSTGMYWDDGSYNAATASFYYNGAEEPNHQVTFVGWNDDYPRTNFTSQPTANGAWLVRNSWGTGWGQSGYFWISYEDAAISLEDGAVFVSSDTDEYDAVYCYDPLGPTGEISLSSDTSWMANVFTASDDHALECVSFFNPGVDSTYEIYVYTGVSGAPNTGILAMGPQSGDVPAPGYVSLPLDSPVSLTQGEDFSIVIKLGTANVVHPVIVECPEADYSSKATASSGQSYVSLNGTTWSDLVADQGLTNYNLCIKGFAAEESDMINPGIPLLLLQ